VGTDLVKSTGLRRGLDKADLPEFRMGTGFAGFKIGLGGVGAGDDGLADVDAAGLMFAEAIEGLIDQPGSGGTTVYEGEVTFLDFPTLLHFPEKGGVLFAPCHQKKAARFAVESAHQRKEFIGILVPKPVDQGKGAVGSRRVNKPTGRFIDDQERGMFKDDRRIHQRTLVQIQVSVED